MQQTIKKSVKARAREAYATAVFTRDDLVAQGFSSRQITSAVDRGHLRRVRKNRYLRHDADPDIAEAVRIGGRLSCLSLLQSLGIFVHACAEIHVHVVPGTSRIRRPNAPGAVLHWQIASAEDAPLHVAALIDAVRQSVQCQHPRAALATLDSVVHHGLLTVTRLREMFAGLPARYQALLNLVDASAASGPETYMRLILRALGVQFETQVFIPGVGYVDFLVEGWLIIECDSKEFHEGWDKQVEDRRRDLAAARQGYVTIRPIAVDIMDRPDQVRAAVVDVIAALRSR